MIDFDKVENTLVVTGGTGFLGRHVCEELKSRGYENIRPIRHSNKWQQKGTHWIDDAAVYSDLRDARAARNAIANSYYRNNDKPVRGVIHLAAVVGGIGANQVNPGSFMHDNLLMGLNIIEACRASTSMKNGGKFVQIGTVCAYPKHTPVPFKESFLWDGYPEETNAPYGIAKKALMELVKAYNKQYPEDFNGISLIPVNLYGPGDNFNPDSSHVIPALIRKIYHARAWNEDVTVWGTGNASREFLFVKDAARGIVDAFEKYDKDEPINLGSGKEIKISDLVTLLSKLLKFEGVVHYDTDKPDGQPRRCLDVSRAKYEFGFEAQTSFEDGLKETIDWFFEDLKKQRAA